MNVAAVANAAWLASSLPAWNRFRRALKEPERAQREILHRLLARNADSAFGRAHRFKGIRSYEEFRERVPLIDYESFESWVTRIRNGEPSVLTSEPVTRLLPTSGSTGGRKLIPFTATFQREVNAAVGPWMVELFRQHPTIALGPAYWSITPALPGAREESAVPIGFDDDSAYLGGLGQRLVEAALAVPSALRLVQDMEEARYCTLLCLLRARELRLISVWHPSFLTLLLDALPACWEELLADIERGGCLRARTFPLEMRRALATSAQPRRAGELRRTGPANPLALWPYLCVVSCWADAQAALPARDLQQRWPGVAVLSKGLIATEAFVSIPFDGLHPIAIRSHFCEFEDDSGAVKLAHELQHGTTYRVIVTTGGGLWRYRLGDLVEVDGFVGCTPSLRFLGRGSNVSDLFGEKLAETFVTRAIATACADCGIAPRFAMLAPEHENGCWRYILFIEGELAPSLPSRLETELRANPHYSLCRDLGQLETLQILSIRTGAYEACTAVASAEGLRIGDMKPQSLSPRTDWRKRFHFVAA